MHLIFKNLIHACIFSSPEPQVQVSFSDQNFFVVCRPCWRCHKLFTLSFSSPEPLGQFQPNLAQSIPGWRGIQVCSNEGTRSYQMVDNWEIININLLLQNYWAIFNQTLTKVSLGKEYSSLFKWRPRPFPRGDDYEIVKKHWRNLMKIFFSRTTGPISTKLGTKHSRVKGIQVCSNINSKIISPWIS